MNPLVSIITVNYNQLEQTLEFIKCIKEHDYKELEIIVVDNKSVQSPEIIKELYPDVSLVQSNTNLGFAGGNNLGIKVAKGDMLFFVNNDVYLQKGTIKHLVEKLQEGTNIGMVSPKIKFYDNPDVIQYAGFNKINKITGRNSAVGSMAFDHGQYDEGRETHYGHGAAMMVRREAIESAGLMPEVFFLYYEEIDWSNQIKNKGYKIFYEPKAVVLHKQSLSSGKNSPLKVFYLTRNRILFMKRNVPGYQFIIFLIHLFLLAVPKNLFAMAIKREVKQMSAFIRALAVIHSSCIKF